MTTVVFPAGKYKIVASSEAKFSNLAAGRNKKDEIDRILERNPAFGRDVSLSVNPAIPLSAVTLFKKGEASKKAAGNINLATLFAAFCVSRGVTEAIYIGRFGQSDMAGTVAVMSGVPFAMTCGDSIHASNMANEFYGSFSMGVVVYGDQDLFEGTDITEISPEDMLSELLDGLSGKELAATKKSLHVFYNGLPPIIIWGAILLVAVGIGVKMYLSHQEDVQKEHRRAAAIAAEQQNNDPLIVYEREQDSAYPMIFKGCTKDELTQPIQQVMVMPLFQAGWEMTEVMIYCEVDGRRGGYASYARRGGTNSGLAEVFPNFALTFAPDMTSIKVPLRVAEYEDGNGTIPAEKLMDVFSFMIKQGTLFQVANSMLGVKVTLTDPAYITGAEPPGGYAGAEYLRGSITATGKLEYLLPFLTETENTIRANNIKFIDVKQGQLPEFSLQGTYYVRKKPVENDVAPE